MPLFDNILGTIGRTPIVRIHKLAPPHVRLYVKIEARNPMGSVKDHAFSRNLARKSRRQGSRRSLSARADATPGCDVQDRVRIRLSPGEGICVR